MGSISARNRIGSSSSAADPFLRQPCRILQGLLDIPALQVGIARKDFLGSRAVGDLANDDRYRNAHAANASPASHDVLVKRDSLEHGSAPKDDCEFDYLGYCTTPRQPVLIRLAAR